MQLSAEDRCFMLEDQLRTLRKSIMPRMLFPEKWGLNRGEANVLSSLYSSPDGFRTLDLLGKCAVTFEGVGDVMNFFNN